MYTYLIVMKSLNCLALFKWCEFLHQFRNFSCQRNSFFNVKQFVIFFNQYFIYDSCSAKVDNAIP